MPKAPPLKPWTNIYITEKMKVRGIRGGAFSIRRLVLEVLEVKPLVSLFTRSMPIVYPPILYGAENYPNKKFVAQVTC